MNTKDYELIEIDGCKIIKGQAPVVQKVDSAIHWLNIISIYQIRDKKFSRVLLGSRNSEYPQAIHCFVPFSNCSPCSPSSPVAPILLILLVCLNPLVPPVLRFPIFPLFPCSPVPHVPLFPCSPVPLFPGSPCSPVLLVLPVPLFPSVCLFLLFPSPPLFPLFPSSPCFPYPPFPPVTLFPPFPGSPCSSCSPVPLVPLFLVPCSLFCSVCSILMEGRFETVLSCFEHSKISKSRYRFGSGKLFCVCCVWIYEQSFNNFENNTTKVSVQKEQLTGL